MLQFMWFHDSHLMRQLSHRAGMWRGAESGKHKEDYSKFSCGIHGPKAVVQPGAWGFLSQSFKFPDMFISFEFQNGPTQNKGLIAPDVSRWLYFRGVLLSFKLLPSCQFDKILGSSTVPWVLRTPCGDLLCQTVIGCWLSCFSVQVAPTQMCSRVWVGIRGEGEPDLQCQRFPSLKTE